MGDLHDIGFKYGTDKATWHDYLNFYEEHLPGRDFAGKLLEIGIRDGSSLRMWHEYYPNAKIIGIDVEKYDWTIDGVIMAVMDGTDSSQLAHLGSFDIIIDDGSHFTADQQASFEWLYYHQLKPGGIYILEDLHTSLMPEYINSELTTLEYLDKLNIKVVHYRRNDLEVDSMTAIIKAGQ
jgi:predicted O-methyltransferase YrrM